MSHSVGTDTDNISDLKPLPFWPSLLTFGLPALLLVAGFHGLMPLLINRGMLPYYAYLLGVGIPLVILLVLSLVWLRLEGYPLTWSAVKMCFRLKRMGGQGLAVVHRRLDLGQRARVWPGQPIEQASDRSWSGAYPCQLACLC